MPKPPSKPLPLDYADASLLPRWSSAAIVCFILGLISGPFALTLALWTSMEDFDDSTDETVGVVTSFGVPTVLLVFQIITLCHIKRHRPELRGQKLIIAGIVATCVWPVVIVAYLYLALHNNPM